MKKYFVFIRHLSCFICMFTFLWSCNQSVELPLKPKVVRKKITAIKGQPVSGLKSEATRPSKQPTAIQTQPEPLEPKAQPPAAQPQQPKAPSPPMVAESDETVAMPKSEPTPVKTKRPAISPKSDISVTKEPVNDPMPKPGDGAEPEKTKLASANLAAETVRVAEQPPIYIAKGKIDPFEPLFKEKKVVTQAEKKKRKKRIPRTPLERIDISQLKLVAIVMAKSGNRAMVEEASGKGYVIAKGAYIGTNSGKVVKIAKDRVIVAEEIEDVMGNVNIRNTELTLPKPPGEL